MEQYQTLLNGVKMPKIGFGTMHIHGQECSDLVAYALQEGYQAVDTATAYQNEEEVGRGLRQSGRKREDYFVTGKIRNRYQGYDHTLAEVEHILKRLDLDQLDLMLVHWPGDNLYVPTWKALVRLYNEGVLRAVGVSNFYPEHLETAAQATGVMPMVNQIECHPFLYQEEPIDYCKKNNIFLVAWSPLMAGKDALTDPVICSIAGTHNVTPAQVILRWHLQNGFGAVPKSANKERIRQNLDVFSFDLTDGEMSQIQGLTAKHIRTGPDPLTYRFPTIEEMLASGDIPKQDSFGNYM